MSFPKVLLDNWFSGEDFSEWSVIWYLQENLLTDSPELCHCWEYENGNIISVSVLSPCQVNMKNEHLGKQSQPFSYTTQRPSVKPRGTLTFILKYADELHIKHTDRCWDANSRVRELVNEQHYRNRLGESELSSGKDSVFVRDAGCFRLSELSGRL